MRRGGEEGCMTEIFNKNSEKLKRKKLRNNLSEAERIIWYRLKNKQIHGYKFRRQYGVGKYVVDFYCPKAQLVIEIDGDSHYNESAAKYDIKRQEYLESLGLRVIRFTNMEVYKSLEGVIEIIMQNLPPLAPPSKGGEI
ncbi:MAG: hypothetical protein US74_C0063G0004 [Parcubacteria group bacterium GW2011_GWA2_38_13]|nr:MAG: hypothetical protein US74_C0063G0004 [Parcubacteria group bacterium GW2011_GWA2_38_13]